MRGYGRDYDHRSWLDRAEDTVRGWFGGGRDYDRDYGWSGGGRDVPHRDWIRGPDRARGEGYRTNNWNNQHANWSTVDRAGGYYGMDYEDRDVYRAGGTGYDRDFGRDWDRDRDWERGRMRGGMGRGMGGGWMGGRGTSGMRDRGMMRGTGQDDAWTGNEYGGGFGAAGGWGDYGRGAYGGSAWRSSTSGGVEPGRYFRGYGNGSTGGHGYEPY